MVFLTISADHRLPIFAKISENFFLLLSSGKWWFPQCSGPQKTVSPKLMQPLQKNFDANTVIIVHLKLIRYSSEVALRSHFPSLKLLLSLIQFKIQCTSSQSEPNIIITWLSTANQRPFPLYNLPCVWPGHLIFSILRQLSRRLDGAWGGSRGLSTYGGPEERPGEQRVNSVEL